MLLEITVPWDTSLGNTNLSSGPSKIGLSCQLAMELLILTFIKQLYCEKLKNHTFKGLITHFLIFKVKKEFYEYKVY